MSAPNANTAPLNSEYAGDEVSALVLDPGWSTTRAGFAGEDAPKSVIPTHYGVLTSDSSRLLFGENSINYPTSDLELRNPWSEDGIVEDFDTAAKLWEYSITSRLTGARPTHPEKNGLNDANGEAMDVDPQEQDDQEKPLAETPLLMTEPGWNTAKAREKYIEIAMEDWGVPAYWLGRSGVLAAFAAGKSSALVIDIGANMTSVTPVVDGIMMKKGVQKSPLAGNFISNQIRIMFKQSTPLVPLTPHYMVTSKTPVDAGAPSQATYKQYKTPPSASFRLYQEERVLTEFKESVVAVWNGPGKISANEENLKQLPARPFEMPDGWNQVFGAERFRVTEGLFNADAALSDSENPMPDPHHCLPHLIKMALDNVDIDQRPQLLANVVVTGGSSFVSGLLDRISTELASMYPSPRIKIHAPGNTVERKYASWIGGSILGSLGSFHQMWISKKEYDEHGTGIVEKRCK